MSAFDSDKVMFEIYREAGYDRQYRVVFFTELDEHNKQFEINRAMSGEHFFDGYLCGPAIESAKRKLNHLLDRLNNGESLTPEQAEDEIQEFLV